MNKSTTPPDSATPDFPVSPYGQRNELLGVQQFFRISVIDNSGVLHEFLLDDDTTIAVCRELMENSEVRAASLLP